MKLRITENYAASDIVSLADDYGVLERGTEISIPAVEVVDDEPKALIYPERTAAMIDGILAQEKKAEPVVRRTRMSELLADFLKRYQANDNEWWKLGSGDMQNLFDEAVEQLAETKSLRSRLMAMESLAQSFDKQLQEQERELYELGRQTYKERCQLMNEAASLKKQLEEKEKEIEGIVERAIILGDHYPCDKGTCSNGITCRECRRHWLRTGEVKGEGK